MHHLYFRMQRNRKYHTDIKTSYALGILEQILPKNFTKKIPRSTSHYWKNEIPENFLGHKYTTPDMSDQ